MAASSRLGPRSFLALAVGVTAALILTACGGDEPAATASGSAAAASPSAAAVEGREVLLDAQELTTLDQPIAYPKKGAAEVTSYLLTLEPGQETGWHKHRVPLYVHVLEGTVTVEYDAGVVKEYPAGTTYMEAQGVWHNGTNKGDDTVRILTVYFGAKGAKNTVERTP